MRIAPPAVNHRSVAAICVYFYDDVSGCFYPFVNKIDWLIDWLKTEWSHQWLQIQLSCCVLLLIKGNAQKVFKVSGLNGPLAKKKICPSRTSLNTANQSQVKLNDVLTVRSHGTPQRNATQRKATQCIQCVHSQLIQCVWLGRGSMSK